MSFAGKVRTDVDGPPWVELRADADRDPTDLDRFPDLGGGDPRERSDVLGVTHPEQIENDYTSILLSRLSDLESLLEKEIGRVLDQIESSLELRADASKGEDIEKVSRSVKQTLVTWRDRSDDPRSDVDRVRDATADHNREELREQFRRVAAIDPVFRDEQLRERFEEFSRQNVELIKGLEGDTLEDVDQHVREAVREGKTADELAGIVEDRMGVSKSRAKLIGRDQISKLNSDLNRVRQRTNNVERYEWISAGDARVREIHAFLHGRIRKWSNPHSTEGHPGDAVGCRCVARGIVEDVLGRGRGPSPRRRAPQFGVPEGPSGFRDRRRSYRPQWPPDGKAQHLQEKWVHGSWNREPVEMKQAAIDEFDLDGVAWNPKGIDLETAAAQEKIDDMRSVLRHQYRKTQKELERRGVDSVTLYRGVKDKDAIDVQGAVESWTRSRKEALEKFANGDPDNVFTEQVPRERVLFFRGGPNWQDGKFGNQREWVVLSDEPKL